ncbi:hypothetical protein [Sulfitobacter sp. EhC04]|uniref:hypothetical protein n=1 Tax=Sulfitobacter sp. EhC04 TaxID=1849168 RepID=UPI0013724C13|nr:hypothetical protein [Sulfitobacter sp. EhC04]
MRMHITDTMIDASYGAMKAEAVKDGHDWGEVERSNPDQMNRLREVIRSMLQAAADVASQQPH